MPDVYHLLGSMSFKHSEDIERAARAPEGKCGCENQIFPSTPWGSQQYVPSRGWEISDLDPLLRPRGPSIGVSTITAFPLPMCEQPGLMPSWVTTWPCRAPSYAVSYGGLTLVPLGPTQAGQQLLVVTSRMTVRRR